MKLDLKAKPFYLTDEDIKYLEEKYIPHNIVGHE